MPRAEQPITIDRVRRALITAAKLVDYHGEVYAPIFERLERELQEMERHRSVGERARLIASRAANLDREPLRLGVGDRL